MKLFIVEDELKLSLTLKKVFEQLGYAVDYCLNGKDAQSYIELNNETLDLIVLDILLPQKNGLEVCKNLRKQHIFTPILMVTAKDSTEDIIAGLDAGADDYITKPYSLNILSARVRALLRRPKVGHSGELKVKELILNTVTRKVHCRNVEIYLTLKEFNLLEYMMQHKNEALDREKILDKIWDINFDSFSNTVDVYINSIRKKLHKVQYDQIVETVRGVGYRIKE